MKIRALISCEKFYCIRKQTTEIINKGYNTSKSVDQTVLIFLPKT